MKFLSNYSLLCLFGVIACFFSYFSSAEELFKCPEQFGYYRDSNDCSKYYVCVFGDALHEKCTGGLHFSLELQTCDWPRNVNCMKDETLLEEKVIEIEDEVFSSSRRASSTLAKENLPPQLKLQIVESDPVSNYQSLEASIGEESKNSQNSAELEKKESRSRTESPDQSRTSQRFSPTDSTTQSPHFRTSRPEFVDKALPEVQDQCDSSSADPLYESDEDRKILQDNYDPKEPKYEEAAPPLVDSEGGIHIADGGHGLDAYARLAHLPGIGDFRVLEKPIYNGNQDHDEDYQRKKDLTLSTKPRSLENYPNSNENLKDPDVVVDNWNGNYHAFLYLTITSLTCFIGFLVGVITVKVKGTWYPEGCVTPSGSVQNTPRREPDGQEMRYEFSAANVPDHHPPRITVPGETNLHVAARHDRADEAESLLRNVADVNAPDGTGRAPIHTAIGADALNVFMILMKHKNIDINSKSIDGSTPLILACRYELEDIGPILVEAGCDINASDSYGKTALHWAVAVNNMSAINLLLSHKANPNLQDGEGETPLFAAAREGCLEAAIRLLESGADRRIKNYLDKLPIDIARERSHIDLVEMFEEFLEPENV